MHASPRASPVVGPTMVFFPVPTAAVVLASTAIPLITSWLIDLKIQPLVDKQASLAAGQASLAAGQASLAADIVNLPTKFDVGVAVLGMLLVLICVQGVCDEASRSHDEVRDEASRSRDEVRDDASRSRNEALMLKLVEWSSAVGAHAMMRWIPPSNTSGTSGS
ncbi:hypothetical protein T492DRAFT_1046971 [Pavlovales sp. CCMP2436]|nr:hypothetical protein T492DRAFT_1046971 [Pavlovales sp. CCMP2436]